MNEELVNIDTDDGVMPTFTCWPNGEGPFPSVVFYMDAPAIREELYDMARRIAADGYYVILPDLFYRYGTIRFPERNQWARQYGDGDFRILDRVISVGGLTADIKLGKGLHGGIIDIVYGKFKSLAREVQSHGLAHTA